MSTAIQRAQRAYDAQEPEQKPEGPECFHCGETMRFTSYRKTPTALYWKAQCPKCEAVDSYDSDRD